MVRAIVLVALAACGGDPAPGTADAPPGGTGEPANLAGMTMLHNQVRAMVDTSGIAAGPLPPLAWDPMLASYAAAWAAKCQSSNGQLLDHDPNRTNVAGYAYIGENIFASGGAATAQGAVSAWAAEKQYFTYPNTCASGQICGHYTQLVWRDTTHVGCALQTCSNLAFPSTIVCDYGPGGNVGGQTPY